MNRPLFTYKIVETLVVDHRRSRNHKQDWIQDYLIEHLTEDNDVESLAGLVAIIHYFICSIVVL